MIQPLISWPTLAFDRDSTVLVGVGADGLTGDVIFCGVAGATNSGRFDGALGFSGERRTCKICCFLGLLKAAVLWDDFVFDMEGATAAG